MKYLLMIILCSTLFSCKFYEMAKNDFATETKIEPLVEPEVLNDKYGTIRLKIPLTENSIGYYDIEDVLGNSNLNSREKGFIKRFGDKIKLSLFKLGVRLGLQNKIKFSTFFDFEDKIDTDFIKSAKIVRVFFTTEDCRKEDTDCNQKSRYRSSFNFVDRFFVNISNYTDPSQINEDAQTLKNYEFEEIASKSFSQSKYSVSRMIDTFTSGSPADAGDTIEDDKFQEINIVKFDNKVPELNLSLNKYTEGDRDLVFNFRSFEKIKIVKKYFLMRKFKHLLESVETLKDSVIVRLKDKVNPRDFFAFISNEQSPTTQKVFIFRLNSKLKETEKYFKSEKFHGLVKDATMIGRSLFVELNDYDQIDTFKDLVELERSFMSKHLDIVKMDRCLKSNCLDLDVHDVNIIPLLEKNPRLTIDSYISVRGLETSDFKYNGYIELEIDIDFPI